MREVPVELRAISKRYGGFEAVKSVSFSLMEGELCALIGENGAGKSTLIRLITGLSEPSSGTISMFGQTGRREIRSCRERLGYMPDLNASYPNLTARDNLVVRCIEWGLPTDRSIDGVLSTAGLGEAGGSEELLNGNEEASRSGHSVAGRSGAVDPGRADKRPGSDGDSRSKKNPYAS